jgi:limonene-1,2-epoxide hydrolase
MVSGTEAVRQICEAWPSLSREEMGALMTPDCVYLNMPMPHLRCTGPDEAFDLLTGMGSGWDITLSTKHFVADGSVILTERHERFVSKSDPAKVVDLHVMGAFECVDGKIAHWRDYFDSREAQELTS